jgi:hypothetical protein
MEQNPQFEDAGYEVEETPGHEYPRLQFWEMYGIFTMDLSGVDPNFALFHVANRLENPIRLRARLTAPWGTEPLRYELLDDSIPLYPWDGNEFEFATTCPFTGGAPSPIAFIRKVGDRTELVRAWTKQNGVLRRTL